MRSTEAPFSYVRRSNIASQSRGARTSNSMGRLARSPSTAIAAARETPNVIQRCHCGLPRVDGQHLHERGEGLVEPDAVPPRHRDEVAEPHVGDLVGHHVGDPLELHVRGRPLVHEERGLAERDRAEVLHRARREVRDGEQVELVARDTACRSSARRSRARTRRRRARSASSVWLAGHAPHAERRGPDHHGRRWPRARRPRRPRDRSTCGCVSAKRTTFLPGAAGVSSPRCACSTPRRAARARRASTANTALKRGLVPARERAPGVGGLELGGRDRVRRRRRGSLYVLR